MYNKCVKWEATLLKPDFPEKVSGGHEFVADFIQHTAKHYRLF
jgi:hypothetical protein